MAQDFQADDGENGDRGGRDHRGAPDHRHPHDHDSDGELNRWPAGAPSAAVARAVLNVDGSIMLKRTAAAAWLTARSHAVPARPVRPTGMELAVVIALAGTYGAALYGDARFVSVLDFIADYGAVALVQRVIAGARPETDFDVTTVATENGRLAEALREARVAFEFLCVTWLEVFLAETHALFEGLGVRIRTPDAHRVPPMSEGLDAEFRDPLAPLTRLFNLLITSIVERLGSTIDKRVAYNRELQRELDQFDLCQS